mmetsp:Transcript_126409/g.363585  ORF Transcript_126409/g.363585 Transcript_126409/m.363585 type:complete len:228 (+) Transcript_126409:925-1608(+)
MQMGNCSVALQILEVACIGVGVHAEESPQQSLQRFAERRGKFAAVLRDERLVAEDTVGIRHEELHVLRGGHLLCRAAIFCPVINDSLPCAHARAGGLRANVLQYRNKVAHFLIDAHRLRGKPCLFGHASRQLDGLPQRRGVQRVVHVLHESTDHRVGFHCAGNQLEGAARHGNRRRQRTSLRIRHACNRALVTGQRSETAHGRRRFSPTQSAPTRRTSVRGATNHGT